MVLFYLAGECYAVNVVSVREIVETQALARVPGAPDFVEGASDLRSGITPIVDLRRTFGLAEANATTDTRIVVVDIDEQRVGLVVDAVTGILYVDTDMIESLPSIASGRDLDCIAGIVKFEDQLIMVVDLEHLFSDEEKECLAAGPESL
jgi:purine-binding chemotaxis protein CheW